MNNLYRDVVVLIMNFLQDRDKINFVMTCKTYLTYLDHIKFNNQYRLQNIRRSRFFDNFTNIILDHRFKRLPISIQKLTFDDLFNESISDIIPNSITHLHFGEYFNQSIQNAIPKSVRYLTFGDRFNQPIDKAIPDGVIYLTFGSRFYQSIKNAIPNSVRYLTF